MTTIRRARRANQRANKIHNPILTKMLVEAVGYLTVMDKNTIENTQEEIEWLQLEWRRYCNHYARYKKALPPDINAFVDNLTRMVRVK